MNLQKNAALIVGLTIPVLLIVAVLASIYIPRYSTPPPQHNFLYISGDYYNSKYRYTVSQNKLVREEMPVDPGYPSLQKSNIEPTFFVYDVATKDSQEISFDDAQKLKLDSNKESPDGYSLQQGRRNDFLFYNGSDSNSWYLVGHNTSYQVELKQLGQYPNIQNLGWIIK